MTTSTTRILLLSLLLLLTSWGGEKLCAQKPSQIYDLIVERGFVPTFTVEAAE